MRAPIPDLNKIIISIMAHLGKFPKMAILDCIDWVNSAQTSFQAQC